MVIEYKCVKCTKIFNKKSNYNNHLNRKKPCRQIEPLKPIKEPKIKVTEDINNIKIEPEKNQCRYCGKIFSTNSHFNRHAKNNCKIKKRQDNEKEAIVNNLLHEIKEIKHENNKNKKEISRLIKSNEELHKKILKKESKHKTLRNQEKNDNTVILNNKQKAVKFSDNYQIILPEDNQEAIINKFPEKLRPFLENINNPLDETQVLVNLFKDKDVRIIIVNELDDFGDYEYVSYYHAGDIAKNINYNEKHIDHWAERWKIIFVTYNFLLSQIGGVKKYDQSLLPKKLGVNNSNQKISNMINDKRTKIDANFISEQELKKVLLKVNTPEAKAFQEWILRQATISKKIFKYIIQIRHQQELDSLKYQLKTNKISEHVLKEATINAIKLFPPSKRDSGLIYIATSPDYQKKCTYKIGYTKTSAKQREIGLQCGNPDINIVYTVQVFDVDLVEKFIHDYLRHLNYNKEFFYISSLKEAKNIVNEASFFVNSFIQRHDEDNIILQKKYIENIKHSKSLEMKMPLMIQDNRNNNNYSKNFSVGHILSLPTEI